MSTTIERFRRQPGIGRRSTLPATAPVVPSGRDQSCPGASTVGTPARPSRMGPLSIPLMVTVPQDIARRG